jgi:plasmid stabilization system protein ParE
MIALLASLVVRLFDGEPERQQLLARLRRQGVEALAHFREIGRQRHAEFASNRRCAPRPLAKTFCSTRAATGCPLATVAKSRKFSDALARGMATTSSIPSYVTSGSGNATTIWTGALVVLKKR